LHLVGPLYNIILIMFSSFIHSSPIMISRYKLNSHKATKLSIVSKSAVKYHSNKNVCVCVQTKFIIGQNIELLDY
jgi:hypothetical protein